ncbi:MAG: recombinase family protein [Bacteroidaceae bacterium]|nr:recombinase family protein [Bacteroidaceae bacterium]
MKKILAIIRTSTERQETESQRAEVKDFCISKGFREKDIVFIESVGASARKMNTKYLQMLENIKETILNDKDIKAVAMWHLNRLGRVEKCLLEMKDFFIANKVQVYIKEPALTLFNDDMTINNGTEIAWSIFATMVKQDTNELMQKLERGRKNNRKSGKFNGGAYGALYGYMVDESGYIVPNAEEVEILTNIFNMYASGKYSVRSLTKELNERGILKRGRKFTESTLVQNLSNTAYIGYSKKTDRKYPSIIDKELFEKVAKIRKENDLNIKTKESKNINLAIKLLKCRHCGHNYIATRKKYTCYKHVMNARFSEDCTNSVAINIDLLDMLLWECARAKHLDYMQTNTANEIESMKERKAVLTAKIETAEKDIESLAIRKERANELYITGEINRATYDKLNGKTAEI